MQIGGDVQWHGPDPAVTTASHTHIYDIFQHGPAWSSIEQLWRKVITPSEEVLGRLEMSDIRVTGGGT